VTQGEFHVTDDPNVVLTTVLGSCVAACMRDPVARVGGMNHFLLPGDPDWMKRQAAERVGVHLMELLVNGLMQRGAKKSRIEAKLFGGAKTVVANSDVGEMNAHFAERFLANEGIQFIGGSLYGTHGRRVEFWPVAGRARQSKLSGQRLVPQPVAPSAIIPASSGSIEFF
jgi:chemotaxis protein CheD